MLRKINNLLNPSYLIKTNYESLLLQLYWDHRSDFTYFVVLCMLTGLLHSLDEMMNRMTTHCSQDGATMGNVFPCITEGKKKIPQLKK